MPLPNRAYGRPGTMAIPEGWGDSHGPVAEGTMSATLDFSATSTSAWDNTLKRTTTTLIDPFASGIAGRVQAERETATGARIATDAVDDQVRVAGYLVAVPRTFDGDEGLAVGTLVKVTACDDDQSLVGRILRVNDIVRGTLRFERDLLCTLND